MSDLDRLKKKYQMTGWLYDILDYPWERQYRLWRPPLLGDLNGNVLEAGVGTGHNLPHYPEQVFLTGIELSEIMLHFAKKRAKKARCAVTLLQGDACQLPHLLSDTFDWYISTFMFCVLPDPLQPAAIDEMARVLKIGGQFRILEIIYSQDPKRAKGQQWLASFVEKVYGARFDRHTLVHLQAHPRLQVTRTRFLKDDTYLLIEGCKII